MPPAKPKSYLRTYLDPSRAYVLAQAVDFDVSKEVAARAYARYNGKPISTVIVKIAIQEACIRHDGEAQPLGHKLATSQPSSPRRRGTGQGS